MVDENDMMSGEVGHRREWRGCAGLVCGNRRGFEVRWWNFTGLKLKTPLNAQFSCAAWYRKISSSLCRSIFVVFVREYKKTVSDFRNVAEILVCETNTCVTWILKPEN